MDQEAMKLGKAKQCGVQNSFELLGLAKSYLMQYSDIIVV